MVGDAKGKERNSGVSYFFFFDLTNKYKHKEIRTYIGEVVKKKEKKKCVAERTACNFFELRTGTQ